MDNMKKMMRKIAAPGQKEEYDKKQKEAICLAVCDKYNFARGNLDKTRETWKNIKKAFDAELEYTVPVGVESPESRVHSPMFTTYIEKLVSMNTIRMVQPYSNFLGVKDRITKIRSYKMENYIFNMFVKKRMALEIVKAVQSACLFGVGFTKTMPDIGEEMPSCIVEAVNNFDLFMDPYAKSLDDASFIIHRTWLSHEEMEKRIEDSVYDESEVNAMFDWRRSRYEEGYRDIPIDSLLTVEEGRTDMREVEPGTLGKFDRYLIYEYYDNGRIVTVGEKRYLLRSLTNKIGYPFQAWYLRSPVANEMWVKSHGELLLDVQKEIDIKRNQRIANINKIVSSPILVKRGAIEDIDDLVIDSNNKIQVIDPAGIIKWEVDDVTGLMLNEIEYLKGEAGDITSIQPVTMGAAAKKERMGTSETANIYSQANMSFDFSSSLMVTTGLIPMINMIMRFCALMFSSKPAMAADNFKGMGQPQYIMPEEFISDYDITVDINPTRKQLDEEKGMKILQVFSQNPYVDQPTLLRYCAEMIDSDYPREMILDQPPNQPMPADTGSAPAQQGA